MLIPPAPADATRCEGRVALRYADVCQDGRLLLTVLPEVLGQLVWPALGARFPLASLMEDGAVPILSRMVLEGGGGPLSVHRPLQGTGCFHLAHIPGPDGPDRILLNMWGELQGDSGWTWGQPAEPHPVHAGRIFAEHSFTRLFAPPGQRKVQRLRVAGLPEVPPTPWPRRDPEALAAPAGARVVARAEERVVFGLAHTDPNNHVNSLVYPRLFEEAALKAAFSIGANELFARSAEMLWSKPFFAGEEAVIQLALHEEHGRLVATGAFSDGSRARARVRLQL